MAEVRFADTKEMLRYWMSLGSGPFVPLRKDVSPRSIAGLLPRVFILSNAGGVRNFRLAGSEFYFLHGKELTGQSFSSIWGDDYTKIETALSEACSVGMPLLVQSEGWSREGVVEVETVIMPLRTSSDHAEVDRLIGLQTFPRERPRWLGRHPLMRAVVGDVSVLGAEERDVLARARGKVVPALKFPKRPKVFRVIGTR
jgi:hypothetical protein